MHRGYIKIWRKTVDSGLFQMPETLSLFLYILMKATHKNIKVGTPLGFVDMVRGQYMSGRIALARDLLQSEQTIRTGLDRLVKAEILTIKSTSRYSIYTIVNYDNYQDASSDDNQVINQQPTSSQPAANQQPTSSQPLNKNINTKEHKEQKEHNKVTLRKTRSDPKPDDSALQTACKATWTAYREAYALRYSIEPVRNAKVNGQIKLFVGRLGGEDAPFVAAHYLTNNLAYYVQRGHSLDSLLADAEKLRTEWATGRSMTNTRARQIDQSQANAGVVSEAMEILERMNHAKNFRANSGDSGIDGTSNYTNGSGHDGK